APAYQVPGWQAWIDAERNFPFNDGIMYKDIGAPKSARGDIEGRGRDITGSPVFAGRNEEEARWALRLICGCSNCWPRGYVTISSARSVRSATGWSCWRTPATT